jgi:hypothetical protein
MKTLTILTGCAPIRRWAGALVNISTYNHVFLDPPI